MATTDILQFSGGGSANVISQATYAGLTSLLANGFTSGTAQSNQVNKVLRQSSFMAAGLAAFCVAQGISVPDDGNLTNLVTELGQALTAFIQTNNLGGFQTGDVKTTYATTAPSGWLLMNDQTIGSASSGATYANNAAQALFTLLWTNVGNSYAPISGGYGASAAADWAANKVMSIPKALGRALAAAGLGTGGNATSHPLGSAVGDEALASHNHSINDPSHAHQYQQQHAGTSINVATGSPGNDAGLGTTYGAYTGISVNYTGAGGSGNMQPSTFVNFMIKL